MPDLRRLESSTTPAGADRHSRTETLLVEGLDCYFGGRYEEAIHIWTRVLFLDRSHARARAYIDRARTALAERQRQSDEMLQATQELVERGQTDAARHLLAEVTAATGEDDRISAVRVRLERLERAHAASRVARAPHVDTAEPIPGWQWPRRSPSMVGLFVATGVLGVLLIAASTPLASSWLGLGPGPERLAAAAGPIRFQVLGTADAALVRARTLYTWGRLPEALQALDRISEESPARPMADRLRVEIQQLLLAGSRVSSGGPAPGEPRR
ncbi:MAG TPA: hypothetical protein VFO19_18075 [Vicinamibacterales bacterium]|nr:hypothetical protein [Vicinamibacterales bacterium]